MVSPEDVLRSGLTRIGVALSNQGYGHSEASALQQHVFCREASVSPVHAKGEGEVLTITPHLLAQELRWKADTMVQEREHETPGGARLGQDAFQPHLPGAMKYLGK